MSGGLTKGGDSGCFRRARCSRRRSLRCECSCRLSRRGASSTAAEGAHPHLGDVDGRQVVAVLSCLLGPAADDHLELPFSRSHGMAALVVVVQGGGTGTSAGRF